MQTDDPYSLVECLKRKPDLTPYSNLITLTSFQGSLSRGITLDCPSTVLMISDISQNSDYYLAGRNIGYNNEKQVRNKIMRAYARSLRTFKKGFGNFIGNHPFERASNLRILGFSSHLSTQYLTESLKNLILQDLSELYSECFSHKYESFIYNPHVLIDNVLKKNYMLKVIEGPDLTYSSNSDLNGTSDPDNQESLAQEGI